MKKVLAFFMAMIMLFAVVACSEDSADPVDVSTDVTTEDTVDSGKEDALDIWNGVEGDEIEYVLTVAGDSLNVVLNRDGSCYAYTDSNDVLVGNDVGRPELDAKVIMYPTNYGSFEAKEGQVTLTLDAQVYYRFVATGKDADALKDAFFQVGLDGNESYKEGYYGKGVIMFETKGSSVMACNYDGKTYTIETLTSYDENNVKTAVIVVNEDGSYNETDYYPDGTVEEISEYDASGALAKREVYSEKGDLEYVETVALKENGSVTTYTDTAGNVIRTEESIYKKYDNGGYYSERTVIENGITVYHNIFDEKCDAEGIKISSYTLIEEIEGNIKKYSVNYRDHKDANNNYTRSEETVDGVLTYYFCAIEKVTVMEGVKGRQHVSYSADTGLYSLSVEYEDENGSLVGKGYDYPANEYVHGEWESFEYVIE